MPKSSLAEARLYGFIDTAYLGNRDPALLTGALIAGGVDIIQVRAKEYSHTQRVALALAVKAAATVPVIMNDDIEAAFESAADGVHLGQEDWAGTNREKLAGMRIVGISTHSLEQGLRAERDGANYIGVGPVFATDTKPDVRPVGLDLVRQVSEKIHIPFFAIGGITLENIDSVRKAGGLRVAVVSAILKAPDVSRAVATFKERLK